MSDELWEPMDDEGIDIASGRDTATIVNRTGEKILLVSISSPDHADVIPSNYELEDGALPLRPGEMFRCPLAWNMRAASIHMEIRWKAGSGADRGWRQKIFRG